MAKEENNKKSITISCRFDKEVYDALSEDAKNKGLSINSLIHSMLKKQIGWQRFSDDLGCVPLTTRTFKDIFGSLIEEKIELKQNAQLIGDLQAKTLVIEEGVVFVGQCNVNPDGTKTEKQNVERQNIKVIKNIQ